MKGTLAFEAIVLCAVFCSHWWATQRFHTTGLWQAKQGSTHSNCLLSPWIKKGFSVLWQPCLPAAQQTAVNVLLRVLATPCPGKAPRRGNISCRWRDKGELGFTCRCRLFLLLMVGEGLPAVPRMLFVLRPPFQRLHCSQAQVSVPPLLYHLPSFSFKDLWEAPTTNPVLLSRLFGVPPHSLRCFLTRANRCRQ